MKLMIIVSLLLASSGYAGSAALVSGSYDGGMGSAVAPNINIGKSSSVYGGVVSFYNGKINLSTVSGLNYYSDKFSFSISGELAVTGVKAFNDSHFNLSATKHIKSYSLTVGIENVGSRGGSAKQDKTSYFAVSEIVGDKNLNIVGTLGYGNGRLNGDYQSVSVNYKNISFFVDRVGGKFTEGVNVHAGPLSLGLAYVGNKKIALSATMKIKF
jgi:hypothetical protein